MKGTRFLQLALVAALPAACQTPSSSDVVAETIAPQSGEPQQVSGPPPGPAASDVLSDPELESGIMLRSVAEQDWGLRLRLPVSVGLTEFDLSSGVSLDNLTTASLVPTAELIFPMNDKWTVLPFAGFGGATALGERKAVSDESLFWLATSGLRAQMWQPFADRYAFVLASEFRYAAAMTGRNGLLGDWGSLTAAAEARRAFGPARDGPRFQPGIYAKGYWYWDPVELEIPGVTPSFVNGQQEFGISLGSSTPYKLWGITLPRIFLGVRTGDGVRSVRIQFGRL